MELSKPACGQPPGIAFAILLAEVAVLWSSNAHRLVSCQIWRVIQELFPRPRATWWSLNPIIGPSDELVAPELPDQVHLALSWVSEIMQDSGLVKHSLRA